VAALFSCEWTTAPAENRDFPFWDVTQRFSPHDEAVGAAQVYGQLLDTNARPYADHVVLERSAQFYNIIAYEGIIELVVTDFCRTDANSEQRRNQIFVFNDAKAAAHSI